MALYALRATLPVMVVKAGVSDVGGLFAMMVLVMLMMLLLLCTCIKPWGLHVIPYLPRVGIRLVVGRVFRYIQSRHVVVVRGVQKCNF